MPRTTESRSSNKAPDSAAGNASVKLDMLLPFDDRLLLLGTLANSAPPVSAVATLKPGSVSDFILQANAAQTDLLHVQALEDIPDGLSCPERQFLCVLKKTGNTSECVVAVSFTGGQVCTQKMFVTPVVADNAESVGRLVKRYANSLDSLMRNTGSVTPVLKRFVSTVLNAGKGSVAVATAAPADVFQGEIFMGTGRPVCGWLRNQAAPDAPLTVLVYEGETMVGSGFADMDAIAGVDQKAEAYGHCFQFFLLPTLYDRKKHTLTFRIAETGAVWKRAEVRFTQAPQALSAARPVLDSVETMSMLNTLLSEKKDLPDPEKFLLTMQQLCCSLDAGDIATARSVFSRIPEYLASSTMVQHKLAECEMLAGEWASASKRFYRIVKNTPGFVWSMLGLVDALVRQRQFKEAAFLFGRLEKFHHVAEAFAERVIYHQLASIDAENVRQCSEQQRTELLRQVKRMILLNQNDYLLTRVLQTIRHPEQKDASPFDPDNPTELYKLHHRRLVLELACEFAGAEG